MIDYFLEINLKHSDIDWLWSNVTSASLVDSNRLTFDQHIFVDLDKKERQKQETCSFTTKFLKSILWLATWNHVLDDKPNLWLLSNAGLAVTEDGRIWRCH